MLEQSAPLSEDSAESWFVRLRDEPVSDDDRKAFEAWRAADPANSRAYGEVERLWAGLDQIGETAQNTKTAGQVRDHSADRVTPGAARPARRYVLRRAVAAGAALAACICVYLVTPPGFFADHRTGPGEQRAIVLPDGSTAHLNTATALSVRVAPDRRLATLYDGEAYFEVATDASRPFVVDAEIGRIRALGTAFSVKRTGRGVEVIVTESKVSVSGPGGRKAILTRGQRVKITTAGLGKVSTVDLKSALAWRRGRLVFNNSPLGTVLRELERYRRGRIVTLDHAVEKIPVTASFAVKNSKAALEKIERTLPVRVRRLSGLLVLVGSESAR